MSSWKQSLPDFAWQALFGVIGDGEGFGLIGGKPAPVPPWQARLNPAKTDMLTVLALGDLGSQLRDPELRQIVKRRERELLEKATTKVLGKLGKRLRCPAARMAWTRRWSGRAPARADPVHVINRKGLPSYAGNQGSGSPAMGEKSAGGHPRPLVVRAAPHYVSPRSALDVAVGSQETVILPIRSGAASLGLASRRGCPA
jgi:hypothetical protein